MIAVIEDARQAKGTALILVVDDDPAMEGGLRFTSPTGQRKRKTQLVG